MNSALSFDVAADWIRAVQTSLTDSSFPAAVPTTTEPTGDGVIGADSLGAGGAVAEKIGVIAFGAGADGATFNLRILGWNKVGSLWVPMLLAELAATLSTCVGVAGAEVTNSERFADTLAATSITWGQSPADIISPADNLGPAVAVVATRGAQKIQVLVDLGTATGGNALIRPV